MNVFDDQKFLIRRAPDSSGVEQVRVTWREIMTSKEEFPPRFDYPLEYLNVAALGLLVGLTQAFLEPETTTELAERLDNPVDEKEFDKAVIPYKELFGIDEGVRFMQGPEPERDNKGRLKKISDIGELLLTVKRGDKEFLNRPAVDWCISLDQIPLLLFSRSTFYEKSAGRGYLTGTTGDLEIRTFLIDPESLRRTIWLNVLAAENYKREFVAAGSEDGYDDWMWNRLPPSSEVPQGDISLRSGLFWTVANLWVDIQELEEPRRCLLTGDILDPGVRAGTGAAVNTTGIGFGATMTRDDGLQVRQSFFKHPNAPFKRIKPEKKPEFTTHLEVREKSGILGEMGGLFYATGRSSVNVKGNGVTYSVAPALQQFSSLSSLFEDEQDIEARPRYDLLCFGFNMLSSKKNVHGGYESELFNYPILGVGIESRTEAMEKAEDLLNMMTDVLSRIDNTLCQGVQTCTLEEVNREENDSGRIQISYQSRIDDAGPVRDASRELWRRAGEELGTMIERIGELNTAEEIERSFMKLRNEWTDVMAGHAMRIFYRYYNDAAFSRSPDLIVAAHTARNLFNWGLTQIDSDIFNRRKNANGEGGTE